MESPNGADWRDPTPTDWEDMLASDDDRPFLNGYRRLLRQLRQEGFRVRATCLAAPLQLEGFLPTGEAMYFRCRHDTCRLDVAPADVNPVRSPAWTGSISEWDRFGASMLDADEAEPVLRRLLARYRVARQIDAGEGVDNGAMSG